MKKLFIVIAISVFIGIITAHSQVTIQNQIDALNNRISLDNAQINTLQTIDNAAITDEAQRESQINSLTAEIQISQESLNVLQTNTTCASTGTNCVQSSDCCSGVCNNSGTNWTVGNCQ